MNVPTLTQAVEEAAVYGVALTTWYPQHGNNAPAERNWSVPTGLERAAAAPGPAASP
jgi:hypothetical protein